MIWVIAVLLVGSFAYEDDHNHTIIRVHPQSSDHMDALRKMDEAVGFDVDYLREVHSVDRPGDMVMKSSDLGKAVDYLGRNQVPHWILEDNISLKRDRRAVLENIDPTAELTKGIITSGYLTFDMQLKIMKQLAAVYPNVIKLEKIGNSTEGRPIIIATIGYHSNTTKPIFWIDSGIHAREWIAHSAGMYALWELVTDPAHTNLLRRVDIVIAPNVNPDGYEYSRTRSRLWRKTRSVIKGSMCQGVDGNRNYPFHWAELGVSFSPCSEIYCGQQVMSEPEVKALVKQITNLKDRIKAYVALHSYGQDILYPWGHEINKLPPDVEELKAAASEMAEAIKKVAGTEYRVANSAGGLYPASGASDDWAKSIGVKYSYTMELSPQNGYFGFELPERFINQVAMEVFAGLQVLAERVATEFAKENRTFIRYQPMFRRINNRRG